MSSVAATELAGRKRQSELGQFLTPPPVADFMASLLGPLPEKIRFLDAGAGAGFLTSAFISNLCKGRATVRQVEAVIYEIDATMKAALLETMRDCQKKCGEAGIQFNFTIHLTDFIQEISSRLANPLFEQNSRSFDVSIVNPPYRKIGVDSCERMSLRSAGIDTSNLYSGFIALIQRLLAPGGQLVGITPRSFCNGPYFRAFREDFLTNLALQTIHVFESRTAAFRRDQVLQENIIFHAIKGHKQPDELVISKSSGEHGDVITKSLVPFDEVVHPNDAEKFIHIPSEEKHTTAKVVLQGLHTSLASLGLAVSTGPVVDFRLKGSIRQQPEMGTVPLLYPCHFNGGNIHWPKLDARKPNAILDNEETRPWLVKSGIYLLTKRFTSKEEPRRLVACLCDPAQLDSDWLGIENHLNFFHANGRGLEKDLALGLFAFLNSTVVDQYFRRFSGHTQVNATDLRKLTYPERETLVAMGAEMMRIDNSQSSIDELVGAYLHGRR